MQGRTPGLEATLPTLLQLQQNLASDFFQSLEDTVALERDGFHYGLVFATKFFTQSIH